MQAIDLGRVGADELDEAVQIDPALADAFREQQRQAQLDAGNAVRDLLEVRVFSPRELAGVVEPVGRMIGGDHLEGAVADAPPDRVLVGAVAGGRAEHPLGTLEPGLVEIGRGQQQVLRAGLGEHLLTPGLGVADRRHRAFGRDVEDDDRLVDQRRHREQTVHGLGLGDPRVADRVVAGRPMAALEQPARGPGEHGVVLGVHRDHGTFGPGQCQKVQHLRVIEPEQRIGHEQLERRIAFADQRRQFLEHLCGRVRDDHVEGVVDHGLGRALAVVGDHRAHRLAVVLGGKRDHGGGAAERGRDRAALEIVGVPDAHARELLDVAVAVDPAGQHELARGIDLAPGARQLLGQRRDPAVADADVAAHAVGRGHDGAVADHQIVVGHALAPPVEHRL